MADNEQQPADRQIGIQKIYVKDFSFESPKTPQVFGQSDWNPKTDLNLRSSHTSIADDHHEVVLTITIEARQNEETVFLVELQQAGLFNIAGYSEEEFKAIVGSFCPNILYPYAREAISGVVAKGGFPEFILQPINFDALYAQGMAQAKANMEAGAASNGGETH